jgi:hypothetical protein
MGRVRVAIRRLLRLAQSSSRLLTLSSANADDEAAKNVPAETQPGDCTSSRTALPLLDLSDTLRFVLAGSDATRRVVTSALRGRSVQTRPRSVPRSPVRHFGGVSPAGGAG